MFREGEAPAEPKPTSAYRAELAIHTLGCLEYGRKSGPYCRLPLTWAERDAVTGDTPHDTLEITKGTNA